MQVNVGKMYYALRGFCYTPLPVAATRGACERHTGSHCVSNNFTCLWRPFAQRALRP